MLCHPFPPRLNLSSAGAPRGHRAARLCHVLVVLCVALACGVGPAAARPQAPAEGFAAPVLLAPGDGTTTTVGNYPPLAIPELTWALVPGATRYRVQLSSDIGFATRWEYQTSNTSFTPPEAGPYADGPWYWRVQVSEPGPGSEFSSPRRFTKNWASPANAPLLAQPADGATLDFFDEATFSWQPVPGAAAYRFQVATDSGFAHKVYDEVTATAVHQPPQKFANAEYYWRVIPIDARNQDGAPGQPRRFTAGYASTPQLYEPENNAQPTFTPTFRWSAVRGARYYLLQYSTDPNFASGGDQSIQTPNTSFTPKSPLPNDVNYYWRVRAISGNSIGDWSERRSFVKRWYIQPQLLTPVNNYLYAREDVMFSWTPVPGASYYRIEVNSSRNFPPNDGWVDTTANTFYVRPNFDRMSQRYPAVKTWYWRVIPIDRSNNTGQPSDEGAYEYNPTQDAPRLVDPLYYYVPDAQLQPHEDRTVRLPIFSWQRLLIVNPADPPASAQVAAYRLQVAADPSFDVPLWTFDTANLNAAPTENAPFRPEASRDYFWRVRGLTAAGGSEVGQWSQTWRTRIDLGLGLAPTSGPGVELLRPEDGSESVEAVPLLEWRPRVGADSYEVQIAADPGFAGDGLVESGVALYAAYAPQVRPAFGTYYWRVRGRQAGAALGDWSPVGRFQLAAQSHWRNARTLGSAANRLPIAADPVGDMTDANYDLTTLQATQSRDAWYFGFNATAAAQDMTYVLYLDLDHVVNSGATFDARGYAVAAIPAHRPEYALYVRQRGSGFTAHDVTVFHWTGSGWDYGVPLDGQGGGLYWDGSYVEIGVPNTAIGMQSTTGSAAAALFSVMQTGGHAQDSVPSDPAVTGAAADPGPGVTTLSRFASVSERMTPAVPRPNAAGDLAGYPSIAPFAWQLPLDTPWFGYSIQVAVDSRFTSPVMDVTVQWNATGPSPASHTYNRDFIGDNTYYWRVRPVYTSDGVKGAWSPANVFERAGFAPDGLKESVTFATPAFTWNMVEGAEAYDIQVDDDPGFGSPAVAETTVRNAYTPEKTLSNGRYYWRVRARRNGDVVNDWSAARTFTLALPVPEGLRSVPADPVTRAATLCWNPVVAQVDGAPVFAAWRYRLQISRDATFSAVLEDLQTEQSCWTSLRTYDDGPYYWRVAAIDGNDLLGGYSAAQPLHKQYRGPQLVSPESGAGATETPTFVWQPVDGAAGYRLQVSLYNTFSPVYDEATTPNTRYTPLRRYDVDRAYYWRVQMLDRDGKPGPFSDATFLVGSLPYKAYLPNLRR